jgi:tRNA-guanine family transglycosylase
MSHKEASGCALLTVHNVAFQLRLMKNIRNAIKEDRWELETFTILESSEILNKTFQFHKN